MGSNQSMKQYLSQILPCSWFANQSLWRVYHHEFPQIFKALCGGSWIEEKVGFKETPSPFEPPFSVPHSAEDSLKNSWEAERCSQPFRFFRLACTVPLKVAPNNWAVGSRQLPRLSCFWRFLQTFKGMMVPFNRVYGDINHEPVSLAWPQTTNWHNLHFPGLCPSLNRMLDQRHPWTDPELYFLCYI